MPQPPPSTMSCPASPSSRSRRDPGFQTDRGPHSRHGAECSHGRCQRSRTRSQAALRAVPSCLLLVVLIKALGVGFFVLEVMKKRKSLARPPCPTQMYTKQPPHTSGTHCTHHARTAGSLCNTLYSLSAGTDNRPPTTSGQPGWRRDPASGGFQRSTLRPRSRVQL